MEIEQRITDELTLLLERAMNHAISGIGYVMSGVPEWHNRETELLDYRIAQLQQLYDNLELGLITKREAKERYMEIIHG